MVGKMMLGPDEVSVAQKPSDTVTLQVNGMPVFVNPDTSLMIDTVQADTMLGPIVVGDSDITV